MKRKWLDLGPPDPAIGLSDEEVSIREKFALECARALLFSKEGLELGNFLCENGININRNGKSFVGFVFQVIAEDPSLLPMARASFTKLALESLSSRESDGASRQPALTKDVMNGTLPSAVELERYAGQLSSYGDDVQFDEYYTELRGISLRLAQEALINRQLATVRKDPAQLPGAVEAVLDQLKENIPSSSSDGKLKLLIASGDSPESFRKVAEELDRFSKEFPSFDLSQARDELILRWALHDPVDVAKMVMETPEVYPLDLMKHVGSSGYFVMERKLGTEGAMEWLASMPEGAPRNQAIYGAVTGAYEIDKEKAQRIAELLDAKDRRGLFGSDLILSREDEADSKR